MIPAFWRKSKNPLKGHTISLKASSELARAANNISGNPLQNAQVDAAINNALALLDKSPNKLTNTQKQYAIKHLKPYIYQIKDLSNDKDHKIAKAILTATKNAKKIYLALQLKILKKLV